MMTEFQFKLKCWCPCNFAYKLEIFNSDGLPITGSMREVLLQSLRFIYGSCWRHGSGWFQQPCCLRYLCTRYLKDNANLKSLLSTTMTQFTWGLPEQLVLFLWYCRVELQMTQVRATIVWMMLFFWAHTTIRFLSSGSQLDTCISRSLELLLHCSQCLSAFIFPSLWPEALSSSISVVPVSLSECTVVISSGKLISIS